MLFLIILLSAITQFSYLLKFPPALFSDEVDLALQVKSFLFNLRDYYGNFLPLQFHSFSDVRTALPIYFTALIAKLVGSIDLAVRLEPAVFGILGVLGIYLLVKSFFGKTAGLWAAFLLTLTPWHFTYSRVGFEVSTLFAFFVLGLYFLKQYFERKKMVYLWLGILLLALTPLIYSTAKLSLFFYPFLILFFPGTDWRKNLINRQLTLAILALFIPLAVITFSGGVASRFSYISVFTDPTLPTEINVARKSDQGEDLPVGTKPLLLSQLFRNKYVVYGQEIGNNIFELLSAKFLFVKGDLNLRHALPEWGMLYKSEAILIFIGLFILIKGKGHQDKNLLLFLIILTLLAVVPGSLTRDGGTHSTRSFLLLVPLIILSAVGADAVVKNYRYLLLLLLPLFVFESSFYFFDYFHRYVFLSERQWHAGLKQVIVLAKEKTVPVVITDSYEPPLIFYLFYSDYPLGRMQELIKRDELLVNAPTETNLGGKKIVDRDVYFAVIDNRNLADPLKIKPAAYFLLSSDLPNHGYLFTDKNIAVRLPSGLPIFYEIETPP